MSFTDHKKNRNINLLQWRLQVETDSYARISGMDLRGRNLTISDEEYKIVYVDAEVIRLENKDGNKVFCYFKDMTFDKMTAPTRFIHVNDRVDIWSALNDLIAETELDAKKLAKALNLSELKEKYGKLYEGIDIEAIAKYISSAIPQRSS